MRLDLKGRAETLAKDIEMKFGSRLILSFRKEKEEKALPTKTLEEHKLSVEDMGRKILLENLKKAGLDPKHFEGLFELLAEDRAEDAEKFLLKAHEARGKGETAVESKQSRLFGHEKA